jgi:hypothetical protein
MPVIGTRSEQQAFAVQLETIFSMDPDAVLCGSIGRTALCDAYDYPDAPPYILKNTAEWSGYRDIDLIFAQRDTWRLYGFGITNSEVQHPIDPALGKYLYRTETGGMLAGMDDRNRSFEIPIAAEIIEPVQRTLLGVKVPTFAVGTQVHIERLVAGGKAMTDKNVRSYGIFATFATLIEQSDAAGEFLDPRYYEPFAEFRKRNVN